MTRRKTHEEFMEKFYKQNKHAQDIEILGTYKGAKIKIKCKCKVDEYEWEATPHNLLRGTGCSKCATNNNKKTHEQFLQELYKINENIEVLGTYVTNKTKIKVRCKLDGYEWETIPKDLLKGHGCPKCARNAKKTHEEFIQRLHQINSNIEILGTYINMGTKIKCRCKIDGNEWETRPRDLLKGQGCPKCALNNKRKTHEQFLQDLYKINPAIEVLGTYVDSSTKIKCICNICGHEWETLPTSLLQGTGCPKCNIAKQTKTHDQFIQQLEQVNPDIEVLSTYVNNKTRIKCKCRLDGHIWEATPNNLLSGQGCPKCKTTKGEKRIAQYLDNLDIHYIYNKQYFTDLYSIGGGLMRPDFIIPSLKIWIEYDGEQHFRPVDFTGAMSAEEVQQLFKYTQRNDQIKNQYAKDNNWILVRIPFTEYDNIEQILAAYIEREQVI